jgi:hypothetical protein
MRGWMIEHLTLTSRFREIAESLGHIPLSQSPENSDDGYESEEDAVTFQKPEEDVTKWVASQLSGGADGSGNDGEATSSQWYPDIDAETSSMRPPPEATLLVSFQVSTQRSYFLVKSFGQC